MSKACDKTLKNNFKLAHISGPVNTADDFFSRLELKLKEKLRLKVRDDIQTTPIDVTTSSSEVANEEQNFTAQTDKDNESEEQTLRRKDQARQDAKPWIANEEAPSLRISVTEFTKIDENATSYSMNGIKANARL